MKDEEHSTESSSHPPEDGILNRCRRAYSALCSPSGLGALIAVLFPTAVFLAVISTGYDGKPYLRGDCPYYLAAAHSIMEDGDLDLANQLPLPEIAHHTNIAMDQRRRIVPKHPIWMSVAVIPFLVLFKDPGSLVFNILQLSFLCFLMYRLSRRIASPLPAAFAVCLTAVFSFLPHYAWNFSPDVFTAVLLLGSLCLLPTDREPRLLPHLLSGVLFGLAMTAKPSFALAGLALPLLMGIPLRKSFPLFALGVFLPLTLWFSLNQYLFGNPLISPYDRMVYYTASGIELHSAREYFDLPILEGAYGQLFQKGKGLIPTSPITIVSLLLLPLLWFRNKAWAIYVAISSLAIFFFYSGYSPWVCSDWGNRFLMPVISLAALPLASALEKLRSQEDSAL